MIELTTAIVAYCVSVAVIYLGLWLYYDRRDRRRFDTPRRKHAFYCGRCGHLYAAPSNPGGSVCPKCGHENLPLRF